MLHPNSKGKYFYRDLSKTWEEHWFSFILDHPEADWYWKDISSSPNYSWEIVCQFQRYPDTPEYRRDHPKFAGKKIPWNYGVMSKLDIITWDIVGEHPHLKWDYGYLFHNLPITLEIMKAYSDIPWNFEYLSSNPGVTWEIVSAFPEEKWSYTDLSLYNRTITWEVVRTHPHLSWDYERLCSNENITWDIIQTNPSLFKTPEEFASNPNLTWEMVQAYPEVNWDYERLMLEKIITWEIVLANPELFPEPELFQNNDNMTWEIVRDNLDINWDWEMLPENSYITPKIILDNPQYPWTLSWEHYTEMDIQTVLAYPDYAWNFEELGESSLITWEDVLSHPELPWNFTALSGNVNITWEIIHANPDYDWNPHVVQFASNASWETIAANPEYEWNWKRFAERKDISWEAIKLCGLSHFQGVLLSADFRVVKSDYERERMIKYFYPITQYSLRKESAQEDRYRLLLGTHDPVGFSNTDLAEFVPRDDYAILRWAIVNRSRIYNKLKDFVRDEDYNRILEFIQKHTDKSS
jgi:hypothetical protein